MIERRAHGVGQFLQWLGPKATPRGWSELTPETEQIFLLTYARHKEGVSRTYKGREGDSAR